MIRAACALAVVAGCDFGIGSDPNAVPDPPCVPGHTRANATTACFAPKASIAIDGDVLDWSAIAPFAISTTCHAASCTGLAATEMSIAGDGDGDADLLVRVGFGTAPAVGTDIELGLVIAASPARPASGGTDRIVASSTALRYEKNGYPVVPDAPQAELAWTADGFEARVYHGWLTYQGVARVSVVALQGGSELAASAPIDACWAFRVGDSTPSVHACEVQP